MPLSRRNFYPRPEDRVSKYWFCSLQPGVCPTAPFPPVPATKATDTSVTTGNVGVEQVFQGAHRAPLVGSLKASSGHRWDGREAWEKPSHTFRHPPWSLHSSTFWPLGSGHPQYPTVSSSASFSSGFDPKEECLVLRWEKYSLDGSKPSLPPFQPHDGSPRHSCPTHRSPTQRSHDTSTAGAKSLPLPSRDLTASHSLS